MSFEWASDLNLELEHIVTPSNFLRLKMIAKPSTLDTKSFMSSKKPAFKLTCAFLIGMGILCFAAQQTQELGQLLELDRVYRLPLASNAQWTETGYDVQQSQEIHFRASGGISLQVGNPMAYCGPEGYDLKTLQQPLQDNNIGAVIGKVVLLISIEINEETGEETRNEIEEIFYIGSEQEVSMPLSGRLFLGLNENVVEDNSGQFMVDIRLTRNQVDLMGSDFDKFPFGVWPHYFCLLASNLSNM